MSSNIKAEVSQFSRDSGRVPVPVLAERDQKERERLIREKQALQVALSNIDEWRKQRAFDITRRRLPTTAAIEATQELEIQASEKRRPVAKQIAAIDERLMRLNSRKKEVAQRAFDEERRVMLSVMLRVERLLETLIEIETNKNTRD